MLCACHFNVQWCCVKYKVTFCFGLGISDCQNSFTIIYVPIQVTGLSHLYTCLSSLCLLSLGMMTLGSHPKKDVQRYKIPCYTNNFKNTYFNILIFLKLFASSWQLTCSVVMGLDTIYGGLQTDAKPEAWIHCSARLRPCLNRLKLSGLFILIILARSAFLLNLKYLELVCKTPRFALLLIHALRKYHWFQKPIHPREQPCPQKSPGW